MWKLFQIAVFIGVTFAGVYYEWTPNGYLLGLIGWLSAYFSTVLLSSLLLKLRAFLRHKRTNDRLLGRRKVAHLVG